MRGRNNSSSAIAERILTRISCRAVLEGNEADSEECRRHANRQHFRYPENRKSVIGQRRPRHYRSAGFLCSSTCPLEIKHFGEWRNIR